MIQTYREREKVGFKAVKFTSNTPVCDLAHFGSVATNSDGEVFVGNTKITEMDYLFVDPDTDKLTVMCGNEFKAKYIGSRKTKPKS